jgi:homoserine kinase
VVERIGPATLHGRGIALSILKGLPLSGGQGGSAASAVAGAVAVNALLGAPLGAAALIDACLAAEEAVAGRHADNIAPALLGGVVLIRSMEPLDLVRLPVPDDLHVVLVRPDQRMRTAEGRAVLPAQVSRAVALHQAAQVGALVAALASGDYALLGRAIDDRIAEPARARLFPGFVEAKAAALAAGALGSSISGSGPTVFALARGRDSADRVAAAMHDAYTGMSQTADVLVGKVDRTGARIVEDTGGAR